MPSRNMTEPKTIVALALVHFRSSTKYAVTTSRRLMPEVSAATMRSRKKRLAHRVPSGILEKTAGSTMKTSPAPLAGSNPSAKTAGKMARPAMRAIRVSRKAMEREERKMFCFSLM